MGKKKVKKKAGNDGKAKYGWDNRTRYPWDDWLKKIEGTKKGMTFYQGTHYSCKTQSFTIQLRQAAKNRDISLSCQVRDGGESVEVRSAKYARS